MEHRRPRLCSFSCFVVISHPGCFSNGTILILRTHLANGIPLHTNLKICQATRPGFVALFLILSLCLVNPAYSREVRTIDPSGQWQGLHGVLSLMLAGDTLSFSYSAVFGATAHLCDGVGVAGLVADGEYHYVDAQGTVAFSITTQGVKMRTVQGIASFCGANWPGDEFTRPGYKPVTPLHGGGAQSPLSRGHAGPAAAAPGLRGPGGPG